MQTVKDAVCVIVKNGAIKNTELPIFDARVSGMSCGARLEGVARKIGIDTVLSCDKADIRATLDTARKQGGFGAALILFDCFPLVTADELNSAYGVFCREGACALTAGAQPAAVWAKPDKADLLSLSGVPAVEAREAAPVVDARSLYEANNAARLDEISRRLSEDVIIPCADGVTISPEAVIEAGATILNGSSVIGSSRICAGAVIGPSSQIENTYIGKNSVFRFSAALDSRVGDNSSVGPYTQLRPNSVLGNRVKVGDFVEIKNSTIGDGTSVAHLTYVGDADVGRMCNFGCGVVFVNYDGENKFRTVVKDYAFVGCNTNLVSPVTVGESAYTAAGATITEDVPDGALAIARDKQRNIEGWAKKKLEKYVEKQKSKE